MSILSIVLHWYIVLSFALMLLIAIYAAYSDVRAYFHINGHIRDNKFGYAYGTGIVLTLFFILAALPFVNIITGIAWIYLSILNKKRKS